MSFNPQARRIYQSLSRLLKDVKPDYVQGFNLPRGTIVTFYYALWKHDPYPTLIVTDAVAPRYGQDGMLRGININYITFNRFKTQILNSCGNMTFSYRNIVGDMYLRKAFRRYKWNANNVRLLQRFDCKDIMERMGIIRAYDPSQAQTIKEELQRQLSAPIDQLKADQMVNQPITQPIPGQSPTPGQAPMVAQPVQQQFPFMQAGE